MKNPDKITKEQVLDAIENCLVLQTHAERNRKIMKRRLIDGLTYEELASEFDLSVQAIQKIVYKNEKVIFNYIN